MMKSIPVWKQELSDGVHAARLASLYCCSPAETASEAARYTAVLDGLEKTFGSHAEAGRQREHRHDRRRSPQRQEPAPRPERGL